MRVIKKINNASSGDGFSMADYEAMLSGHLDVRDKGPRREEPAKEPVASAEPSRLDPVLLKAFSEGKTVKGEVVKEIKGGYEITVNSQRGFCPFSAISLRRDDSFSPVGGSFEFIITEYVDGERGVNLVLSRKAVLEAEREKLREELREDLWEGEIVSGTVVRLLNFGAFVDLGGVDGLIPLREMSWGRDIRPESILKIGDKVDVKILKLDWDADRITLSLRALLPKPEPAVKKKEAVPQEEETVDVEAWKADNRKANESFGSLGAALGDL